MNIYIKPSLVSLYLALSVYAYLWIHARIHMCIYIYVNICTLHLFLPYTISIYIFMNTISKYISMKTCTYTCVYIRIIKVSKHHIHLLFTIRIYMYKLTYWWSIGSVKNCVDILASTFLCVLTYWCWEYLQVHVCVAIIRHTIYWLGCTLVWFDTLIWRIQFVCADMQVCMYALPCIIPTSMYTCMILLAEHYEVCTCMHWQASVRVCIDIHYTFKYVHVYK